VKDYDVIVVGAASTDSPRGYLAKAGCRWRSSSAGQCGAHCDTVELGIPGFLHSTHAAWLSLP